MGETERRATEPLFFPCLLKGPESFHSSAKSLFDVFGNLSWALGLGEGFQRTVETLPSRQKTRLPRT